MRLLRRGEQRANVPSGTQPTTSSPSPNGSRDPSKMAIKAVSLSVAYGDVGVLHDVELDAAPGEIVGVLGPNGAGKTTLLLTLAGFLKPKSGHVELFGSRCSDPAYRRAKRGVRFLGEDRQVFASLTVRQNLKLVETPSIALDRFPELEPLYRRRAGLLSGGEQQMLALGRALAGRPKLLLVDELSLGLAPLVRERLLAMLRQVANEDGTSVVIVEQSVRATLDVADRVYVLRRGAVAASGPASRWRDDLDVLADLFLS